MRTGPEKPALHRSNLYRGCSSLPMENFLCCLCEKNLKALIIEGYATDAVLNETWIIILSEYHELKGDAENNDQWVLSRDVTVLQNHLFLLDKCVEFLKVRWSDSVADSVRKLGYTFNPPNKENYFIELDRVVNKSKTRYIHLKQLIKQLAEQIGKIGDKPPQREYFDTMLINFEEMQKVSYSMETIPVLKYVQLEKKYFRQIELMEAKLAKHGGH